MTSLTEDYRRREQSITISSEPAGVGETHELMTLKEITQAQVANALGDRAAASSILSGRRQVSKTQAKKLGNLFHVDAGRRDHIDVMAEMTEPVDDAANVDRLDVFAARAVMVEDVHAAA